MHGNSKLQAVKSDPPGIHLEVPSGPQDRYRLAQLDDYHSLQRRVYPWEPPIQLSLRARVSGDDLPGTWGSGFWNDSSSLNLGFGGGTCRFLALPQ